MCSDDADAIPDGMTGDEVAVPEYVEDGIEMDPVDIGPPGLVDVTAEETDDIGPPGFIEELEEVEEAAEIGPPGFVELKGLGGPTETAIWLVVVCEDIMNCSVVKQFKERITLSAFFAVVKRTEGFIYFCAST